MVGAEFFGWMCHSGLIHLCSYALQRNILHNLKEKRRKNKGIRVFFSAFVEHIFAGYLSGRMRLGDEGVHSSQKIPLNARQNEGFRILAHNSGYVKGT